MTEKVLDPVCGMTVVPERAAAHVLHAGKDFHFCSKGCAAKFQQDPAKYLAAPGSSPMQPSGLVTLGGSLGTPTAKPPQSGATYICPMDPEVRASKPGPCPICGMALEPRTITAEEENPELNDMSRRFWIAVVLTAPLIALAMGEMLFH